VRPQVHVAADPPHPSSVQTRVERGKPRGRRAAAVARASTQAPQSGPDPRVEPHSARRLDVDPATVEAAVESITAREFNHEPGPDAERARTSAEGDAPAEDAPSSSAWTPEAVVSIFDTARSTLISVVALRAGLHLDAALLHRLGVPIDGARREALLASAPHVVPFLEEHIPARSAGPVLFLTTVASIALGDVMRLREEVRVHRAQAVREEPPAKGPQPGATPGEGPWPA